MSTKVKSTLSHKTLFFSSLSIFFFFLSLLLHTNLYLLLYS